MDAELRRLVAQEIAEAFDRGYARGYSAGLDEAAMKHEADTRRRTLRDHQVRRATEYIDQTTPAAGEAARDASAGGSDA